MSKDRQACTGKKNHKKKSMDWPPKTAPKVVGTAQHTGRLVNEPQWRSGGLRRAKRWKNVSTGPIKNGSSQQKIDKIIPKIRQPFEQSCTTHSSQWFGKQFRRQASILGQKQCERQESVGPKSHQKCIKHLKNTVPHRSACIKVGVSFISMHLAGSDRTSGQ